MADRDAARAKETRWLGVHISLADVDAAFDRKFDMPDWCGREDAWRFYARGNIARRQDRWADEVDRGRQDTADCWAIRTMQSALGLSHQELRAIQNDVGQQGRGDWTHLPGPYRAIDIESCLGSTPETDRGAQAGFPSSHGMQQCGCWNSYPPLEAPEPLCQSGYVRLNQCAGSCPGGGSPYAYICQ
jgi:hypothetical protein